MGYGADVLRRGSGWMRKSDAVSFDLHAEIVHGLFLVRYLSTYTIVDSFWGGLDCQTFY